VFASIQREAAQREEIAAQVYSSSYADIRSQMIRDGWNRHPPAPAAIPAALPADFLAHMEDLAHQVETGAHAAAAALRAAAAAQDAMAGVSQHIIETEGRLHATEARCELAEETLRGVGETWRGYQRVAASPPVMPARAEVVEPVEPDPGPAPAFLRRSDMADPSVRAVATALEIPEVS